MNFNFPVAVPALPAILDEEPGDPDGGVKSDPEPEHRPVDHSVARGADPSAPAGDDDYGDDDFEDDA